MAAGDDADDVDTDSVVLVIVIVMSSFWAFMPPQSLPSYSQTAVSNVKRIILI